VIGADNRLRSMAGAAMNILENEKNKDKNKKKNNITAMLITFDHWILW